MGPSYSDPRSPSPDSSPELNPTSPAYSPTSPGPFQTARTERAERRQAVIRRGDTPYPVMSELNLSETSNIKKRKLV